MLCMTESYYEWAVKQRDSNFRKTDIDAVNYNFDTMMYLSNVREEHVVTYREAVKAARMELQLCHRADYLGH